MDQPKLPTCSCGKFRASAFDGKCRACRGMTAWQARRIAEGYREMTPAEKRKYLALPGGKAL